MELTTKEKDRFLSKVNITKSCWLWKGTVTRRYGHFGFRGKYVRAHRFSYALFIGPIDPGKYILHKRGCGNPLCVNPHHLYQGTHQDNVRDRIIWGKGYFGTGNNTTLLTENDIREIRRLREEEGLSLRKIAAIFNIDKSHVRNISLGRAWKHIT